MLAWKGCSARARAAATRDGPASTRAVRARAGGSTRGGRDQPRARARACHDASEVFRPHRRLRRMRPCAAQEHAERVGMPLGEVHPVRHVMQPSTAAETTPEEARAMAADPGYGTQRPAAQREAAARAAQAQQ
jgi:hypothetical protein